MKVVHAVVFFIYSGTIDPYEWDYNIVLDIMVEAHTLDLPRLKQLCSDFIFKILDRNNAQEVYDVAVAIDAKQLRSLCKKYAGTFVHTQAYNYALS